jgi:hypothetical protein
MSDTLPIHRLVRRKELLRMPQEGFSRGGWRLWYPHFGHGHTPKDGFCGQRHSKISRDGRRCGRCRPCGRKRTRPQATWKTAQTAVFHSAPTDHRFLQEEREQRRTLHVCQSDCLNRGVHPTAVCLTVCPAGRHDRRVWNYGTPCISGCYCQGDGFSETRLRNSPPSRKFARSASVYVAYS